MRPGARTTVVHNVLSITKAKRRVYWVGSPERKPILQAASFSLIFESLGNNLSRFD
jgi:hypothetical protein